MRNRSATKYTLQINILAGISLRHQALDRSRQIAHLADYPIGLEIGDRYFGIAKFDPDHGNAGAAGDAPIPGGGAHPDSCRHPSPPPPRPLPPEGRGGVFEARKTMPRKRRKTPAPSAQGGRKCPQAHYTF